MGNNEVFFHKTKYRLLESCEKRIKFPKIQTSIDNCFCVQY